MSTPADRTWSSIASAARKLPSRVKLRSTIWYIVARLRYSGVGRIAPYAAQQATTATAKRPIT